MKLKEHLTFLVASASISAIPLDNNINFSKNAKESVHNHNWLSNFWKHLSGTRNEEKPARIDTHTRQINEKQFADNNNDLPLQNSSQPKKTPHEAIAVVPGKPMIRSNLIPRSFFNEKLFTPRKKENGEGEEVKISKEEPERPIDALQANQNSADDQHRIKESLDNISTEEQNVDLGQNEIKITRQTDVNNNESRQEDDGFGIGAIISTVSGGLVVLGLILGYIVKRRTKLRK
ncbi:hypothetical protein O9G_003743 [Rozella allomycis CSF55]|uniref:Uncharacterized protein n=1 Tax=Rozella allomycis (strain CSF55) TaxID=988480 RepID=A0A075B038_ROZAC|nr:hypothetical protein O9G_003743 [Rozella allomycis CSF55]|eukprot:EPZ34144.1 hypothetical protein O9G_003743 [Rozella allomycis CSF55]